MATNRQPPIRGPTYLPAYGRPVYGKPEQQQAGPSPMPSIFKSQGKPQLFSGQWLAELGYEGSLELIRQGFRRVDIDSDKSLSRAELLKLLTDIFGDEMKKTGESAVVERLMKAIDSDGSGRVTLAELEESWRSWFHAALKPVRALVIIDVQNDFIDGTLSLANCPAKHNAAEVVPVINRLRHRIPWDVVAISMDSHPHEHCSFHETVTQGKSPAPLHPTQDPHVVESAGLFSTVVLTAPDGVSPMSQTLWPRHCVANTHGGANHANLVQRPTDVIVHKGTNPRVDSYSAFFDNSKFRQTPLLAELRARGVTHVYCVGLALDVCVAFTALHAAEAGFATVVIEDACRGVDLDGIRAKKELLGQVGVPVVQSSELPELLQQSSLDEALQAAGRVIAAREAVELVQLESGHAGKARMA